MTDRDLALSHMPHLMVDRCEPYAPLYMGYSVLREAGQSPSSKHVLNPGGDVIIEYAVWYDWDIQHLYDLEHIWVRCRDGEVVEVTASFHGQRVPMEPLDVRDGRPTLYAEPGKHAHWADPQAMQKRSGDYLAAVCGPEAGSEGVHRGNPFFAAGRYVVEEDADRLAREKAQRDAFTPSYDFVEASPEVVPWAELDALIPQRVVAELKRLKSKAVFPVHTGETVTAFALSALEEPEFHGEAQPMEDRVDYRFVNGWVDVGDLPCRTATWREVRERATPEKPSAFDAGVNLPGFSRRVDFSGFWHVPHRLVRSARTTLRPEATGTYSFRLKTCGGVHIWVDGEHVVQFEPFTRNAAQEMDIELPLRASGSDVVIRMEEMAERDTGFFLELTWLGEGVLETEVPCGADPEALATLMQLAREVRPSQVVFGAGDPLTLAFDDSIDCEVTIEARVAHSVHLRHLPPLWSSTVTLARGETVVNFGQTGLPDGYHPLSLTFRIGDTVLDRSIAFAKLNQPRIALSGDLAERKRQALVYAADHGERRIGTVLARLALGRKWSAEDADILDDTLSGIEARRDCSDFVLVPLLWVLERFSDQLPEAERVRARRAVLDYRYWMTEPGNDAMWFWSENHVLCFHVSQYLAGGLYTGDVFSNSDLMGHEQQEVATEKLHRWFDAVEEDGLAEWNSAAYYPIDFIGLLALAELGAGRIRERARGLLDRLFTMIALHTMQGTCAGSMGRAYDKELRAGPLTELSPFAAVAFGEGWLNDGVAALPMFCLADYVPPDVGHFVSPERSLEARYVQGHGDQGRLALYKTKSVMLSACIDGDAGLTGHQQHLLDVQFGNPFARIWINHPGEDDPWGSARPSYWAGNGVMPRVGMHQNVALFYSKLTDGAVPFTHAYVPKSAFDSLHVGPDWMVAICGKGAAILKATGPIGPVTSGPGKGIEWRVHGEQTGWAVIATDLPEGGARELIRRAEALSLTFGEMLSLRESGASCDLHYDEGLFVDGKHAAFPTTSRIPVISEFKISEELSL